MFLSSSATVSAFMHLNSCSIHTGLSQRVFCGVAEERRRGMCVVASIRLSARLGGIARSIPPPNSSPPCLLPASSLKALTFLAHIQDPRNATTSHATFHPNSKERFISSANMPQSSATPGPPIPAPGIEPATCAGVVQTGCVPHASACTSRAPGVRYSWDALSHTKPHIPRLRVQNCRASLRRSGPLAWMEESSQPCFNAQRF